MGVELALELGSDVGRQVGKVQSEMEQRDQGRISQGASGTEKQGDRHVTAEEQAWEDNISKLREGWVIESW